MQCEKDVRLVAAYTDGQLPRWRHWSMARHLRGCGSCARRQQEILELRTQLRAQVPYHRAPEALRARVQALAAQAPSAAQFAPARQERGRWLLGGALAGAAGAVAVLLGGNALLDWRSGQDRVVQAVDLHVQATLAQRSFEIASSDQHTVKPWLSARLDYSPPVRDLAAEGFPLDGARIDTLHGRRVAVLIYHYHLHVIDVYVQPAGGAWPAQAQRLRGFNAVPARGAQMDWLAVSDVGDDVLAAFVRRLSGALAGPGAPD